MSQYDVHEECELQITQVKQAILGVATINTLSISNDAKNMHIKEIGTETTQLLADVSAGNAHVGKQFTGKEQQQAKVIEIADKIHSKSQEEDIKVESRAKYLVKEVLGNALRIVSSIDRKINSGIKLHMGVIKDGQKVPMEEFLDTEANTGENSIAHDAKSMMANSANVISDTDTTICPVGPPDDIHVDASAGEALISFSEVRIIQPVELCEAPMIHHDAMGNNFDHVAHRKDELLGDLVKELAAEDVHKVTTSDKQMHAPIIDGWTDRDGELQLLAKSIADKALFNAIKTLSETRVNDLEINPDQSDSFITNMENILGTKQNKTSFQSLVSVPQLQDSFITEKVGAKSITTRTTAIEIYTQELTEEEGLYPHNVDNAANSSDENLDTTDAEIVYEEPTKKKTRFRRFRRYIRKRFNRFRSAFSCFRGHDDDAWESFKIWIMV